MGVRNVFMLLYLELNHDIRFGLNMYSCKYWVYLVGARLSTLITISIL